MLDNGPQRGNSSFIVGAAIAVISAMIGTAGGVGGTYLANKNEAELAEEQFRHDDERHLLDLRRQAYVRFLRTADKWSYNLAIKNQIPEERQRNRLQDAREAGDAVDEVYILGPKTVSAKAGALVGALNDLPLDIAETSSTAKSETLLQNVDDARSDFIAVARAETAAN